MLDSLRYPQSMFCLNVKHCQILQSANKSARRPATEDTSLRRQALSLIRLDLTRQEHG